MRDVNCPFCGLHPYEYVDIGVGEEAIAVNCCEYGAAFFDWRVDNQRINRIGHLLLGDIRHKKRGERLLRNMEEEIEI